MLAGLLSVASAAQAQTNGYYEFIPYYSNNPFLFCTVGVPQDCWVPISKEYGTFSVTNPYCFNPYSAQLFARVCPKAFPLGPASYSIYTNRKPPVDPANADAN